MNWIFIAILAQVILGSSLIFDKLLLRKKSVDPYIYSFWLGVLGLFAILLLFAPFEGKISIFDDLNIVTVLWGVLAGSVFILSMFFMFVALSKGEASNVLPIIGALAPVFSLVFSYIFLSIGLGFMDLVAFCFMVVGGGLLLWTNIKHPHFNASLFAIASSLVLALSNVFSKLVFNEASFVNGFVLIKVGGVVFVALIFLFFKKARKRLKTSSAGIKTKNKLLYFANRAYAAVGSVIVYVAISMAHPALVESTQGLKYVIIFFAGWFFLSEHFKGKVLFGKIVATFLIIVGLSILGLSSYANSIPINMDRDITWAVTFSSEYSKRLGLDWKKNYEAILDELKPQKIRIVAYWDDIETEKGKFDFSELDWEIGKAGEYGSKVLLVVGMKVPRWPECHIPEWASEFEVDKKQVALQEYMKVLVERYKDNSDIFMWQVENEPFLVFGLCPERGENFVEDEINLVKSIDPSRPILMTDGGEFGRWDKAVRLGDVFGTTMYRKVHSLHLDEKYGIGVFEYPFTPSFFKLKEKVVRAITGEWDKPFIVIELQAEAWGPVEIPLLTHEEQMEIFPSEYFNETMEYAKETGFEEYYLWGAEWWYWLRENQNDSTLWNKAKNLINQ